MYATVANDSVRYYCGCQTTWPVIAYVSTVVVKRLQPMMAYNTTVVVKRLQQVMTLATTVVVKRL